MAKRMPPGERLKAWRKEEGLSQAAAGKLAGVSQAAWCGYERGRPPKMLDIASRIDDLTNSSRYHVAAHEWVASKSRAA